MESRHGCIQVSVGLCLCPSPLLTHLPLLGLVPRQTVSGGSSVVYDSRERPLIPGREASGLPEAPAGSPRKGVLGLA